MNGCFYPLPWIQVLKDSGVFEYTWTELELWLDQLARVEADQQETVIQFLERVSLSQSFSILLLIKSWLRQILIANAFIPNKNFLGVGETGVQFLLIHW